MAHFAGVGLGTTLAPGILWARMQDAGTLVGTWKSTAPDGTQNSNSDTWTKVNEP